MDLSEAMCTLTKGRPPNKGNFCREQSAARCSLWSLAAPWGATLGGWEADRSHKKIDGYIDSHRFAMESGCGEFELLMTMSATSVVWFNCMQSLLLRGVTTCTTQCTACLEGFRQDKKKKNWGSEEQTASWWTKKLLISEMAEKPGWQNATASVLCDVQEFSFPYWGCQP